MSGLGIPLRIEPDSGISLIDGAFRAVSFPLWLRICPTEEIARHSWIKLRYSSSFFDEPLRPLIRFTTASGAVLTQAMNGPILGRAEWIGRVPENVVSVSISPGRQLGPFSFRIDDVKRVSRRELLQTGFLSDPPWAFWAVQSRLLNAREEAWQALKYARGGTSFQLYQHWRNRLARPLDLHGFDIPRADWTNSPAIHLLVSLDGATPEDLFATITSLQAQVYKRWFLHAADAERASAEALSVYEKHADEDHRLCRIVHADGASRLLHIGDDDWISVISSGDVLEDYALAAVTEHIAEKPQLTLVYSDEDMITSAGIFHSPLFKPDWSPIFYETVPCIGRLTAVRHRDLLSHGSAALGLLSGEKEVLGQVLSRTKKQAIGHIRRVLYHRRRSKQSAINPPRLRQIDSETEWPEVTVVIPTRDQAKLLSRCLHSLMQTTDYPCFKVVLVDNGSTQGAARQLLAGLEGRSDFKVIARPGLFNYSRLCNDGAVQTKSPMLLFLNNDIECFDPGWLKAMVRWATRPEIGAVGAKLLFANRRIQHAGVVLGMGGLAGHIYHRCSPQAPGYLNQLQAVREVSAVTAACIAVARDKFDAIGGFDAENLPVELNDIDLCLRLAESGLKNLWTPEASLIHVQSASRGAGVEASQRYSDQRRYFARRWSEVIRDDPYFHPGLSLFSRIPALG
jgi:O-antigen biosynthesis protein